MNTPNGDGWRPLRDGEVFQEGDVAFGMLSNGNTGWGYVPPRLVGQAWCEGASALGHPSMAARRVDKDPPGP